MPGDRSICHGCRHLAGALCVALPNRPEHLDRRLHIRACAHFKEKRK